MFTGHKITSRNVQGFPGLNDVRTYHGLLMNHKIDAYVLIDIFHISDFIVYLLSLSRVFKSSK